MTRRSAKHFVRKWTRKTGWDIVRFRGVFEDVQRTSLSRFAVDTMVDVGANQGQYSQRMRQIGHEGLVYAFEPIPAVYKQLCRNFAGDPYFVAQQIAIGARDEQILLNISANTMSSSVLPMAARHVDADPRSTYVDELSVTCRQLDSCDITGQSLWLKVDVQGEEGAVLDGATSLLKRVQVLQLELSLVELYETAPLIEDLLGHIRRIGFAPVFFEPGFQDPTSGQMLQIEGLFARI